MLLKEWQEGGAAERRHTGRNLWIFLKWINIYDSFLPFSVFNSFSLLSSFSFFSGFKERERVRASKQIEEKKFLLLSSWKFIAFIIYFNSSIHRWMHKQDVSLNLPRLWEEGRIQFQNDNKISPLFLRKGMVMACIWWTFLKVHLHFNATSEVVHIDYWNQYWQF